MNSGHTLQATSCSKVLKDKKYFHSEKFHGNAVLQSKKVVQKSE